MRLLKLDDDGEFRLTKELISNIPPYAILSHTWGEDQDEITFEELNNGPKKEKPGYRKIRFCGEQARRDQLEYFWVDTCCINKANFTELSEAINSMFRWYAKAEKCYVYLSDVEIGDEKSPSQASWEADFRNSRWFTRGWTLQELLASSSVEFFSREEKLLGNKLTLETLVHKITKVPISALQMKSLSSFSVDERLQWAVGRETKRPEDRAYCLLGIFNVFMPLIYGEEQNAFERLKGEITRRAHSTLSDTSPNVHWTIVRSRNPLFTGREDILEDLERIIQNYITCKNSQQQQCQIVITGIGGQGKSELCLQLAHRLRQLFWGVFWIDVSTMSLAENAFMDLAQRLSLSAPTWKDALIGLSNLKHTWLLVLDNADDPDIDYQQYIPTGYMGVVLLTSRNSDCEQYETVPSVKLEGLSNKAAQELLFKAARVPLHIRKDLVEDARRVASLLQSHALALIQAGAYVLQGHCTLATYPQIFERQRHRLLGFRPKQARSRYGDVYATFEASADILKTSKDGTAQDALQLIPLLAVCGPNRFPLSLFELAWKGAQDVSQDMDDEAEDNNIRLLTPWHVSHLPSIVHPARDSWDPYQLLEAVNLLKTLSLVSTDCVDGTWAVSMHPLVHAWARDRQDNREQHTSWLQMGCLVALGLGKNDSWTKVDSQLRAHIEMLLEWEMCLMFAAEPQVLIARILINIGAILFHLRSDTKLSLLLDRLSMWLTLDQLSVMPKWIGFYDLLACNLGNCGKIKESVALSEGIVRIQERVLAEDHPDRLNSELVLAQAYDKNGQVKEAITLLERVTKIGEQVLGEDHPHQLIFELVLAQAYEANGQVEEAVALLERVVRTQERVLGVNHPNRLMSEHNLAHFLSKLGRHQAAFDMIARVVDIQQRSLPEDNPDRLGSEHIMAVCLWNLDRQQAALDTIKHVVDARQQCLSEDDSRRLSSEHNMAIYLWNLDRRQAALDMMSRVVDVQQRCLPEGNRERLASERSMAIYLWDLGHQQAALDMIAHVVDVRQRCIPEDNPDRLGSEHTMAAYLWELGRHQAGYDMMVRVVDIRQRSLDTADPLRKGSEEWLELMRRNMNL